MPFFFSEKVPQDVYLGVSNGMQLNTALLPPSVAVYHRLNLTFATMSAAHVFFALLYCWFC